MTSTQHTGSGQAGDGHCPEPGNAEVSRPLILRAALTIIDRDGVDGLSMRRLSQAVGRDPTVSPRSSWNNSLSTPLIRTGPANCAASHTISAGWPSNTRMSCHCW